ncbi:decaprenyl-phosphate phosphoribosyltransferase [PVC group bacterium]|nr:decaprenyl-phosphate phosphoribosyltransferase [PVC group bacterium]
MTNQTILSDNPLRDIFAALRPGQWTKNAIILAAFIFAYWDKDQPVDLVSSLFKIIPALAVFCIVSSAVYLLNDVKDIETDRNHPIKKMRPIASGKVSARTAITIAVLLIVIGGSASWILSTRFFSVLATYFLVQMVYTLAIKKVALVDVFVIACGFVLRAIAGAVVLDVEISPWLLLCTFLLALFLALCKRRHEKILLSDLDAEHRLSLDKYNTNLLNQLISIVSAATIVSYAIYTLWPNTVDKFGTSKLGFTIPFVMFGIFRYLDLVYRHNKGGRPEKILLTDIPLLVDIFLYGITVIAIFVL